ncbi:PUA domain-containing protein [Hymenobacter humi]|uniref:PUA domain-containing protein n=1 Tax=Hymenobacter humi TaxID=1411620 RepID=A0ABW2TZU3_9BACT
MQVNAGAVAALTAAGKAVSLLPVGVLAIEGTFRKGDIIRLTDEKGHLLGLGIAEYGSDKALERLGQQHQRPLVHYDYLFLTPTLA